MAVTTVSEASAVNAVLDHVLGPRHGGRPPSDEQMRDAVAVLARGAHNKLHAGWTAESADEAWKRRAK